MARLLRLVLLVSGMTVACGCAHIHYERTQPGTLHGKVIVEWRMPDGFVYKPDPQAPLVFRRRNGDTIRPEEMFTDGGSIPRPFWVLRNYSPWGYAPAFIVHDWLFTMQDCKKPGYERYSLEEAAVIMSEVMKTMMEAPGFDYGSESTVYLMYKAVQTEPARQAWTDGTCIVPGPERLVGPPDQVFVVEFPPPPRR